MTKPPLRHVVAACTLVAAAALLAGGCAAQPDPVRLGAVYPAELAQARTLDIQVFRRENRIWMTNTTAAPIGPGRLWLNKWFSHGFDELGVGETAQFRLSSFRDQYGERFRGGGGFFAAREPEAIVLAQVHQPTRAEAPSPDPGAPRELVGLIVVGGGPGN